MLSTTGNNQRNHNRRQTSFYVSGKGFFQDYLNNPLLVSSSNQCRSKKNLGINELTKLDLFDFIFDDDEELVKIEIRGLNMLILTKSGKIYFTNSKFRFPSQFTFSNFQLDNQQEAQQTLNDSSFLIQDCSLSNSHALFLTRDGIVLSWNLKKKDLNDCSGLKIEKGFNNCKKILRVLAFDNGQSFFIGEKVFMSESIGGAVNSIDIRKVVIERANLVSTYTLHDQPLDKINEYDIKGPNRVRITNFHEIELSSHGIYIVGCVSTYTNSFSSYVNLQTGNGECILDMSCSNTHTIVITSNRVLAMGENESGQLCSKDFEQKFYDDYSQVLLPFEREDGDELLVATDDGMTLIAHSRIVNQKKSMFIHSPSFARTSTELLKLVSNDCSTTLMENEQFISSLTEEELQLLNKLVDFISFRLFEFNSDDDYSHLLDEELTKDMTNTITTLFLLNDISDIGSKIKEHTFSIFKEHLNLENVMDSLEQISNYLGLKILKNSKTSILMLAVKACFTFMKKHFKLVSETFQNDPRFQKIISKVQQTKTSSMLEIAVSFIDPCQCNVSPDELLTSLYNTNSGEVTFILDHLGERSVRVHKSVMSCSPVLTSLISNVFGDCNTQIYNLFDFVQSSQDSVEEMILKSSAIECVIKACYLDMRSIDNSDLKRLVSIFFIAHQFQIEHILKYCEMKLENILDKDNFEDILTLATMVEQEEWSDDFLNRLTVYYLKFVEPTAAEQVATFQVQKNHEQSVFSQRLLAYHKAFMSASLPTKRGVVEQQFNQDKFRFTPQVLWTFCNPEKF